jgi:hypothetical protein
MGLGPALALVGDEHGLPCPKWPILELGFDRRESRMPRWTSTPKTNMGKLREVEFLVAKCSTVAEATARFQMELAAGFHLVVGPKNCPLRVREASK